MSDELKKKMREIFAEEWHNIGDAGTAFSGGTTAYSSAYTVAAIRAIDRIAALPPEPPTDCCDCDKVKGEKGRVEEVRDIIINDTICGRSHCTKIAKQIVATEPRAMSRKEIVEVVACYLKSRSAHGIACDIRQTPLHNAPWAGQPERLECWVRGIHYAIDALAGKTSASDDEVEAWKKKYERQVEHSKRLETACGEKTAKIRELEQVNTKLKWNTPAERPDRLDRIVKKLNKIPRNESCTDVHIRLYGDGSWSVRYFDGKMLCNHEGGSNPEQVLAEYVAGLDKPDDLRRELELMKASTTASTEFPAIRKLAEKELKGKE